MLLRRRFPGCAQTTALGIVSEQAQRHIGQHLRFGRIAEPLRE